MVGVLTRSHLAKCSRCRRLSKQNASCRIVNNAGLRSKIYKRNVEANNKGVSDPEQTEIKKIKDAKQQAIESQGDTGKKTDPSKNSTDERTTTAMQRKRSKIPMEATEPEHPVVVQFEKKMSKKHEGEIDTNCRNSGIKPSEATVETRMARAKKSFWQMQPDEGNGTASFVQEAAKESFSMRNDHQQNSFLTCSHMLQRKRKRMSADMYSDMFSECCVGSEMDFKSQLHDTQKGGNKESNVSQCSINKGACIEKVPTLKDVAKEDTAKEGVTNEGKLNSIYPLARSIKNCGLSDLEDYEMNKSKNNALEKVKGNKTVKYPAIVGGVLTRSQRASKRYKVLEKKPTDTERDFFKQGNKQLDMQDYSKDKNSETNATTVPELPIRFTRSKYNKILDGSLQDVNRIVTKKRCKEKDNQRVHSTIQNAAVVETLPVTRKLESEERSLFHKSVDSRTVETDAKDSDIKKSPMKIAEEMNRKSKHVDKVNIERRANGYLTRSKLASSNDKGQELDDVSAGFFGQKITGLTSDARTTGTPVDEGSPTPKNCELNKETNPKSSIECFQKVKRNSEDLDSSCHFDNGSHFSAKEANKDHILELRNSYPDENSEFKYKSEANNYESQKKCALISTNLKDTAGRQMRPRPLDPNHHLQVVIEGRDQYFNSYEELSFPWQPWLKKEGKLGNFPVDSMLSNIPENMTDTNLPRNLKTKLHSCRIVSDYDDIMKSSYGRKSMYNLPGSYIRCFESVIKRHGYGLDYDIEEDDQEWLLNYNQQMTKNGVALFLSEDKFEELVEYFEKESSLLSGENIIEPFEKASLKDDLTAADEKCASLKALDSSHSSDKARCTSSNFPTSLDCCICNGGENSVLNPVYTCKFCGIFVHKFCYGICSDMNASESVSARNTSWLCRKCEVFGTAHNDVCCAICSKTDGALKPTTDPGKWAHVICAMYTNETFFLDTDSMEPIDGVSVAEARSRRQRLLCCFCCARVGSCARCSFHGCRSTFHISCGVNRGAYFEIDQSSAVVKIKYFCPRHAIVLVKGQGDKSFDKEQVLASPKERKICPQRIDRNFVTEKVLEESSSMNTRVQIDKKEVVKLEEILTEHIGPEPTVSEVYNYWINKRLKRGPLLLKLQQEESIKTYGIFNQDCTAIKEHFRWKECGSSASDTETMQKLTMLREELESMRLVAEKVLKRERIKKELIEVSQQYSELELFAVQKKFGLICCFICSSAEQLLHCATCKKLFCFQCYKQWNSQSLKSYRIVSSKRCFCLECEE